MSNPLAKYFRQPAIYIKLPSGGKFYPAGAIATPPNNEYPVYPMTALDEIAYRTPDALFNGSAIVEVVKSCVPAIQDPWAMPVIDLDALLIGIRIASFGHTMEIESTCPKCGTENQYDLDLRVILDQVRAADFDTPVVIGDLKIFCKPMSYQQLTENNRIQFEEQRLIQSIPDSDLPDDEKLVKLREALQSLSKLTLEAVAGSIAAIHTVDAVVVEPEFIHEYISKADRQVYHAIRNRVTEIRQASETQPLHITCTNPECQHEYDTPFTLDVANFFE